jgi:hypothetical protein
LHNTDFSAVAQDHTPEVKGLYPHLPYGVMLIDIIYQKEKSSIKNKLKGIGGFLEKNTIEKERNNVKKYSTVVE